MSGGMPAFNTGNYPVLGNNIANDQRSSSGANANRLVTSKEEASSSSTGPSGKNTSAGPSGGTSSTSTLSYAKTAKRVVRVEGKASDIV